MTGYEKSRDYCGPPVTPMTYVWAVLAVSVFCAPLLLRLFR